nr:MULTISPECIES: hypothetical protein [Streptomyces]
MRRPTSWHPGGCKIDDLPPGTRVCTEILGADRMTPALGAGQLAMQLHGDDAATLAVLAPLADARATRAAVAERSLLRALAGHCHAPRIGRRGW